MIAPECVLALVTLVALSSGPSAQGCGSAAFTFDGTSSLSVTGTANVPGFGTLPILHSPSTFRITGGFDANLTTGGGGSLVQGQIIEGAAFMVIPDLTAIVPHPNPSLPPVATLSFTGVTSKIVSIDPNTRAAVPFSIAGNGAFNTWVEMRYASGTLTVQVLGANTTVPMCGTTSAPKAMAGTITPDMAGFDFNVPINVPYGFTDPASGAIIAFSQTGSIRAWGPKTVSAYSNGPVITNPGGAAGGLDLSQLETGLGLTIFGFGHQFAGSVNNSVADDFTITDAGGWNVTDIDFLAYQTGSGNNSTITSVRVQIWRGNPSTGQGTVVFGDLTTNRLVSGSFSNIYRATTATPLDTQRPLMTIKANINAVLPPGQYWVQWQMTGSLASGPWVPPVTILGTPTTGDAVQFVGASNLWQTCVSGVSPQGLPFQVNRLLAGGGSAVAYGVGKVGTNGVPVLTSGCPVINSAPIMSVTRGLNGMAPLVVCGLGQASIPFPPFGTILVNLAPGCQLLMPAFDVFHVSSVPVPIPNDTNLLGGIVTFQEFHIDPGASGSVAHSGGLQWTIGS